MADSSLALSKVHPDWISVLPAAFQSYSKIIDSLGDTAPSSKDLLNVFQMAPSQVRVVIVGQDPYPTPGDAIGYAFATSTDRKTPASLQNIFKEISDEFGSVKADNSLHQWIDQGVFLINRVLSTSPGESFAHRNVGWQEITNEIFQYLGTFDVVALLMGKEAAQCEKFFKRSVLTPHPSPLSAYRGFFGSGAFKQVNSLLAKPINW